MISSIFRWLLILLHFMISLNALIAGALLLFRPDGSLLGMETGWLNQSPFKNYLIPGSILFFLIGCGSMLTLTGLIARPGWGWPGILNIYPARHWSWTFSLYMGIILIIWITVQLMMTRYFWLQPAIILCGLAIIIITLMPALMKYYEIS